MALTEIQLKIRRFHGSLSQKGSRPLGLVIGAGVGNLWGVQTIFCPNYPKFARKIFMRQTFSPKCSVAVGTLYFPLSYCHKLENRKFGTWNLAIK